MQTVESYLDLWEDEFLRQSTNSLNWFSQQIVPDDAHRLTKALFDIRKEMASRAVMWEDKYRIRATPKPSDTTAKFVHDCKTCVYVGSIPDEDDVDCDLYACLHNGGDNGSLLLRRSDECSDYSSMDIAVIKSAFIRGADMQIWREALTYVRERQC